MPKATCFELSECQKKKKKKEQQAAKWYVWTGRAQKKMGFISLWTVGFMQKMSQMELSQTKHAQKLFTSGSVNIAEYLPRRMN